MISKKSLTILTLSLLFLGTSISFADQALVQRLSDSVRGNLKVSYHAGTKQVRFLGAPPSASLPQPFSLKPDVLPEHAATSFLSVYGRLFGLADPNRELSLNRVRDLPKGRSVVKFKQVYHGIPVIAGEIIVNMDRAKNVRSVNGEISPDIELDITPRISLETAQVKTLGMVSRKYGVPEYDLQVASSELSIYNPVLLGHHMNKNFLAWKFNIRSEDPSIREFVVVDAKTAIVLLSFNQIDTALDRIIYDNENDPYADLPGYGPVRVQGGDPTGDSEIDNAYDYLGDTYDFYAFFHGRDSIDDAGMSLIATVRYCDLLYYLLLGMCPYPNAYWDGSQMVFGEGFAAADDVVGHELTHGVTENESALFYYMQSGAINESFSDIWGEFIDQSNHAGTDTDAVKWKLGEDLPKSVGVIRNMKNPPAFKDPDSMLSSYYSCKDGDNGGVHINSGVNNKAAYLMTDGGTFNGYTIKSLGMEKVAKIYYEVQTNLLTSGADYQDLADGLYQGCVNLIGTDGIEVSDCNEVLKAVNAVHMHALPDKCKNIDAALCNGGTASNVFFDDMEITGSGNWISAAIEGSNEWYYPQNSNHYDFDATYTTSGEYNLWGYDYGDIADYYIAMSSSVPLPLASNMFMHFNHAYEFDYLTMSGTTKYYDGGVLEYSTNDGATWQDAQNLIVVNGYDGKLDSSWDNPLGGRSAFAGISHGYISTKLDLSSLAGESARFRFRIGTDSMIDSLGWFIDDVRIYTCSDPDPLSMTLTYPDGGETFGTGEPVTITWSGPTNLAYATLQYSIDNGLTWKTIEKNVTGIEYPWTVPFLTTNKSKCLIKVTGYNAKGVRLGTDKSNSPFAIHVVDVTSPNGGESLTEAFYDITWTTRETKNAVKSVKLYYTMNAGITWTLIETLPGEDPGDHTHRWEPLPAVTIDKTKCKIKVVLKDAAENILASDVSDGFFTIPKPIL